MKVEITALAEPDLETIYLHIRADSPTRAVEWREGLLQAAQALERVRQRCSLAPESGVPPSKAGNCFTDAIASCSPPLTTRCTSYTFVIALGSNS
jgi:hypothetical protein